MSKYKLIEQFVFAMIVVTILQKKSLFT